MSLCAYQNGGAAKLPSISLDSTIPLRRCVDQAVSDGNDSKLNALLSDEGNITSAHLKIS